MYKKQMLFQKFICLAALFCGVTIFIYSLGIMTDLYDCLYSTIIDQNNLDDTYVKGSRVYYDMQLFNRQLLVWSIVSIASACLLFLSQTNVRRRYYASNYVFCILYCIVSLFVSVWGHVNIEGFKAQWINVDFEELKQFSDLFKTVYTESTFWFDIHYLVFGLSLVVSCLLVFNNIWKIRLMKEEARLIAEGER